MFCFFIFLWMKRTLFNELDMFIFVSDVASMRGDYIGGTSFVFIFVSKKLFAFVVLYLFDCPCISLILSMTCFLSKTVDLVVKEDESA